MKHKQKVVAVVGPTASGKTSLSIELAKQHGGEVISADSRQVYRSLDIGSGKVTAEEMDGVPHHLLDVAEPMTVYTGSDFLTDATAALEDVLKRSRCPIVAGGTFFYLDLLRGKSQAAPVEPDEVFRKSLEGLSNATLHEQLYTQDPARAAAIDPHNRRRLIRALEIVATLGTVPPPAPLESPYDWLIIGIDLPQTQLHENIHTRLLERIEAGMIEEVHSLLDAGVTHERLDALGLEYRYLSKYLQGELTKDEMLTVLETKIKQFAKRQLTWLKRDDAIEWFAPEDRSAIFRRV
ncbi:tRNA (adenosine(37)-N6)-dimethylallyltransferase MiaA, partial [Candidatus Kaiserbacteria bacterium]|nr:tRNA (adenosine(37)-N6)-dimethylallyltransferase MiaA [Candidatus Kaiserbacteria bacterium]